ncbi:MAG TPA: D-alanine--D-alanine ligase family protein [Acidothermaceae bacterium]
MDSTDQAGSDQRSTRPRVAVVFGGRSTEHAISCVTASSVLAVLDRRKYDVVPIGITREGRWVLAPDEPEKLAIHGGELPEVSASAQAVVLASDPTRRALVVHEPDAAPQLLRGVDVVLPLLHGPYGEDGAIQGLLEMAGVPYVGAGVFASAAAMDKQYMKLVLAGSGLPDIPHVVVTARQWERDKAAVRESVASLGFPVFVKPARGGSSIGISKVREVGGLDDAIELARRADPKVIVEAMIEGREVEVGVLEALDGGPPEVSVPAEIVVRGDREFYDFDAKYLDDTTRIDVPADLPEAVVTEIRRLAALAFEALSCEGLARVDFFVTPEGEPLVNEVNTMPGFTPTSVFPRVWAATGLSYPALVDRLVQTALRRRPGLR